MISAQTGNSTYRPTSRLGFAAEALPAFCKIGGKFTLEKQILTGQRMQKSKLRSVQTESWSTTFIWHVFVATAGATINLVPTKRMASLTKMDADLMGASSLKTAFHQGILYAPWIRR
jgi:hypothetical protein